MKLERILAIATFIMIVTVAVWAALRPDLIPRFNLVLLAGLIAVTTIYAYSTIQISRATKDQAEKMREQAEATRRQADESVKMAKEMREQRLSEARPYLLLRLHDESVRWDPELGIPELDPPTNGRFTVTIVNAGKGPAIDLRAGLWRPDRSPFWDTKGYLVSGDEWKAVILGLPPVGGALEWLPELSKLVKRPEPGVVAVEYKDVHNRKWASYLCLVSPVNDATVAIDGEQNILELKGNDS